MAPEPDERAVENISLISQLSERLGVDLPDLHTAIASEKKAARVTSYDNSFNVNVFAGDEVEIESPRAPGVNVRLINTNDIRSRVIPKGAIYEIKVYRPREDGKESLPSGDIATIYADENGFVLDNAARSRARKLPDLPVRDI